MEFVPNVKLSEMVLCVNLVVHILNVIAVINISQIEWIMKDFHNNVLFAKNHFVIYIRKIVLIEV